MKTNPDILGFWHQAPILALNLAMNHMVPLGLGFLPVQWAHWEKRWNFRPDLVNAGAYMLRKMGCGETCDPFLQTSGCWGLEAHIFTGSPSGPMKSHLLGKELPVTGGI